MTKPEPSLRDRAFAMAELGMSPIDRAIATHGPHPDCNTCGGGRVVPTGAQFDACPECTRRAEFEWKVRR